MNEVAEVLSEMNVYKTVGVGTAGGVLVSYVHTTTSLMIGLFILIFVAIRALREILKLRDDLKGVDERKAGRRKVDK